MLKEEIERKWSNEEWKVGKTLRQKCFISDSAWRDEDTCVVTIEKDLEGWSVMNWSVTYLDRLP